MHRLRSSKIALAKRLTHQRLLAALANAAKMGKQSVKIIAKAFWRLRGKKEGACVDCSVIECAKGVHIVACLLKRATARQMAAMNACYHTYCCL
jgi:hypothetical protein